MAVGSGLVNGTIHREVRPNKSLKGDPHREGSVGRNTYMSIIGLAAHTAFPAVAP